MVYIFTWNPNKTPWRVYDNGFIIENIKNARPYDGSFDKGCIIYWSAAHKLKEIGDFIFLMQGMGKDNGVIGYGKIVADQPIQYEDGVFFYPLRFTELVDYKTDAYPKTEFLKEAFPMQWWTPQGSGTKIKENERDIMKFIQTFLESDYAV